MDRIWFGFYLAVAVAALVQAALMALQTYEHRRYARRRMAELQAPQPQGRACVLAPCKGVDADLEQNLIALLDQDYPNYEVLFIVESAADPACAVIRKVMAQQRAVRSRLLVAGPALEGGQKNHNLLFGIRQTTPDIQYLAFVDSDAQPRREWLRWLLYRLDDPGVGATTGYRWFLPQRSTWANHVLYSINCSVALFLGPHRWHYVWGGSWAIRRETFAALNIGAAWQGTLSDDMVAAALLRRHGLQTVFQPPCMVVSPADYRWLALFHFLRRQYLMVRSYSPKMWMLCLASGGATAVTLVAGGGLAVWGFATGWPQAWIPALLTATLYGLGIYRGWLRQDLVRSYFPHLAAELRSAKRFDVWGNPAAAVVHWCGLIASAVGRHVVWRGIRYRLGRDGRVERVFAAGEAGPPVCLPFPAAAGQRTPELPAETGEPTRPRRKAI